MFSHNLIALFNSAVRDDCGQAPLLRNTGIPSYSYEVALRDVVGMNSRGCRKVKRGTPAFLYSGGPSIAPVCASGKKRRCMYSGNRRYSATTQYY